MKGSFYKWLLFGTYYLPSQADIYYFDNLDKALGTYSIYVKRLHLGDFNTELSEPRIDCFVYEHELHNLVKEKTSFRGAHNTMAFQYTTTVFIGLSDFHKLALTVLKTSNTKNKRQKITYKNYKNLLMILLMKS